MAEAIFYSNNHFVTPAHLYGRHKLEVLRFLRQLPRRAVKHLRHLTWVIRHLLQYDDTLRPGHFTFPDWKQVLRILDQEAALSHLTITIDMSLQHQKRGYHPGGSQDPLARMNNLLTEEWLLGEGK